MTQPIDLTAAEGVEEAAAELYRVALLREAAAVEALREARERTAMANAEWSAARDRVSIERMTSRAKG